MSEENTEKKTSTTEFQIQTAKVKAHKKDGFFTELIYNKVVTDENGKTFVTPVSEQPPYHPHMDLFQSLKLLVPHMMIETDFATTKDFSKGYIDGDKILEDSKVTDLFKVTGIHIKEKHEARHVVIVGRKVLRNGKVINLSPMINIENFEDGYVYAEKVSQAVEKVIEEFALYTDGKHAPDAQLKMFNDDSSAEAQAVERTEASEKQSKKADKKAS